MHKDSSFKWKQFNKIFSTSYQNLKLVILLSNLSPRSSHGVWPSAHINALSGAPWAENEELGKTPGGVEAKIHDPEESNYALMAGRVKASGAAGKYQLRRAAAAVMSRRGNASGTMSLQLLTLSPGDAHCATGSSESAGRTCTGGGGSTGPRLLGFGSSSCNLCQPWQQVQCSSNCINPVYENIPEKRAEQLPMKATCLQRKFKSSRRGLVVVPFYITQSFWYKQLPGDW